MIQFLGQLMKLPLEAFVYSMEMFVKTMRGIQQISYLGIDMVADGVGQPLVDASGTEHDVITDITDGATADNAETAQHMPQKEERKMSDRDLLDDMLKLVRYKILFVKRDYEHAFPEKEELVYENINPSDYTGWKLAEFIQKLNEVTIPDAWRKKNYPRAVREDERDPKINKLDEDDKKYLRVYYEVLERYPRERFRYEEEQIDVLKQIRDKLQLKVDIEGEQVEVLRDIHGTLSGGSPP